MKSFQFWVIKNLPGGKKNFMFEFGEAFSRREILFGRRRGEAGEGKEEEEEEACAR